MHKYTQTSIYCGVVVANRIIVMIFVVLERRKKKKNKSNEKLREKSELFVFRILTKSVYYILL